MCQHCCTSLTTMFQKHSIRPMISDMLGLKKDEKKAFLYLLENPGETVGAIAKKTGISRPSLYGYLKNLTEKGFITQSQKNGIKSFTVASEEKINSIFDQEIKEIQSAKESARELFRDIKNKKPWQPPRMQIFEGDKELRNFARDVFLHRDIKTESYWPIKQMIDILGERYFWELNKERIKRRIWVNAIWPESQRVDMARYPFMGEGNEFFREIRIAPREIDFSMGYWIYENKVAFISSRKSNFGFIIENEEFVQMLRSQFNTMWQLSKPLKTKEEISKKLFKRMMSE